MRLCIILVIVEDGNYLATTSFFDFGSRDKIILDLLIIREGIVLRCSLVLGRCNVILLTSIVSEHRCQELRIRFLCLHQILQVAILDQVSHDILIERVYLRVNVLRRLSESEIDDPDLLSTVAVQQEGNLLMDHILLFSFQVLHVVDQGFQLEFLLQEPAIYAIC